MKQSEKTIIEIKKKNRLGTDSAGVTHTHTSHYTMVVCIGASHRDAFSVHRTDYTVCGRMLVKQLASTECVYTEYDNNPFNHPMTLCKRITIINRSARITRIPHEVHIDFRFRFSFFFFRTDYYWIWCCRACVCVYWVICRQVGIDFMHRYTTRRRQRQRNAWRRIGLIVNGPQCCVCRKCSRTS